MDERPILFNDTMVRAILAGTKTQTRRVVQSPAKNMQRAGMCVIKNRAPGDRWYRDYVWSMRSSSGVWGDYTHERFMSLCPYGQPGDRLWVREAFALSQRDPEDTDVSAREPQWWDPPVYRADGDLGGEWTRFDGVQHVPIRPPWRPSTHMPRWASRLTLEVTSVRVERVQSISEEDAQAEGAKWAKRPALAAVDWTCADTDRESFCHLWESINGARPGCSWEANPWVWVVAFKVVPRG